MLLSLWYVVLAVQHNGIIEGVILVNWKILDVIVRPEVENALETERKIAKVTAILAQGSWASNVLLTL